MKIVIIGAGEIGYELASTLSQEQHDVTVLDHDKNALNVVEENLDVLTNEGNATSVRELVKAGADQADIVISVTSIDEVNMISSMISKRLGSEMVIARVRNDELSREDAPLSSTDLGIDVLIHPEQSAAHEIVQLLKRSSASDVVDLADGKMQLIGIRLDRDSPLIGKSLAEYASEYLNITFRVVAIARKGRTIIPKGATKLQALDQVFFISKMEQVPEIIETTGRSETQINSIMIAGGTPIGSMVARELSSGKEDWSVKLIEPDYETASELAAELENVLVLNGNGTDPDLLATEGIRDTDAFISVTDDEESNIISCLMAKHMEVKKTIALVSKGDYIPLSQTIGLDAAVNKKHAASNEIQRYVRRGKVIAVSALQGIQAEVLELKVSQNTKFSNKPLHDLTFPDGCVVGGILHDGEAEIATGDSVIEPDDHIIIFCLPQAVDQITALFQ